MIKEITYLILSGCAIFICFIHTAKAEQCISAEEDGAFANYLYKQGDYFRAITEYKRIIFFSPGTLIEKDSLYMIGMSYFRAEKWDNAIESFNEVIAKFPVDGVGQESRYMLGKIYYLQHNYSSAILEFQKFCKSFPKNSKVDDARLMIGRSYLRQGEWQRAKNEFESIPMISDSYSVVPELSKGALEYRDISTKSPTIAGGLSAFMPGAGQLYLGRKSDAAVAFFLNGSFIWAAIQCFENGDNVAGLILSTFEAAWYMGNIYNAVDGAHKYNNFERNKYLDDLMNRTSLSYNGNENEDGRKLLLSIQF